MDREIPLSLPSLPTVRNRGAISWSSNGLVAVGSGTDILIIDENRLVPVQVIHSEHKSSINRVIWNYFSRQLLDSKSSKYQADLLSTDTLNNICVWDVEKAQVLSTFTHPESKQLLDVKFCWGPDNWKHGKIYLLYSSNLLVVYDIFGHQVFQNFQIMEPQGGDLTCFDINPFSTSGSAMCAFVGDGSISLGVVDCAKASEKVVVTAQILLQKGGSNIASGSPLGHPNPPYQDSGQASQPLLASLGKKQSSSSSIRKLVSDIIVGPENPLNPVVARFGTLEYLHSLKDHLIVWSNRFVGVFPAKTRPCLYTLHENGTIFLRKYSISNGHHSHNVTVLLDTICASENPRFSSKKSEVLGGALIPSTLEHKITIYLSDGRLSQATLNSSKTEASLNISQKKLLLPTPVSPHVHDISTNMNTLTVQSAPSFNSSLSQHVKGVLDSESTADFKMKTKRTTPAIGQICCLKTLQNGIFAVGTASGHLLVIACPSVTGRETRPVSVVPEILKKILVQSSSAVSGMEVTSESELLVWTNLSFSANPKCELSMVEINLGAIKVLKQDEPSHIGAVRVSPSKLYFVVVYKNGSSPSELWDLPRRQLIKTLPSKLPPITCVQWKTPSDECKDDTFFMTDLGTFLFTFKVDGNRFANATCVKLEAGNVGGIPVALFTRKNLVFRGDSSGSLVIYNTDKKTASPGINLGRGPLFKILDFDDFFVAQFSDQLELWDLNTVQRLRVINSAKLKTTEMALAMSDVLAVIVKNSGSLKFLRLHTARSSSGDWYPTVRNDSTLLSEYPQFWSHREKCLRVLKFIYSDSDSCSSFLELTKQLNFEPDEVKFWAVFCHSVAGNETEPLSDPDLFSSEKTYKDTLVKLAQAAWQLDPKKRDVAARTLIFAGETEKSAEILLDTDPADSKSYIANGLKASVCVGSSMIPESTKAVLKIVATNLIASGKVDEGLELFCMLHKHSEACNYIESTNDWDKALLLCKTSLNNIPGSVHAKETLSRYAQYLNTSRFVLKAASLFVYIGKYDRAVEVLFSARRKLTAFIALHILEVRGVAVPISQHVRVAIKLDFARFIFDVGLQSEAIQFCEKLAPIGNLYCYSLTD
ncbi:unnamed protein product [Allacma fusca]|uniref:WDR11 TPR domain-containing protein n=1 Tax=Allacma fusca TaxID=39272 RepID=A0A8J2K0K4_9HEXA|nr:unnamed protein product [Allacma fusca]